MRFSPWGAKISGCTIHFADDAYDNGPHYPSATLFRSSKTDTIETLAARVFKEECKALPEAIMLYADGRLKLDGRLVRAPRA